MPPLLAENRRDWQQLPMLVEIPEISVQMNLRYLQACDLTMVRQIVVSCCAGSWCGPEGTKLDE